MINLFADYQKHRQATDSLLEQDCSNPILMFCGEAGMGKSTLIRYCHTKACIKKYPAISFDLGKEKISIKEIFSRSIQIIGENNFRGYNKLKNKFSQVTIDSPQQEGNGNKISVEYHADSISRPRQITLNEATDAWFKDLSNLDQIIVFLFDTFEKGETKVCDWLVSRFLPRIALQSNTRAIFAGKEIPDEILSWEHKCIRHELKGVIDPNDWSSVIKNLGCSLRGENEKSQMDWFTGVCDALQGHPLGIMQILEARARDK